MEDGTKEEFPKTWNHDVTKIFLMIHHLVIIFKAFSFWGVSNICLGKKIPKNILWGCVFLLVNVFSI
jgi:hypothetical protein